MNDLRATFPPRKHIFVESRISWLQTADDLPIQHGYGGLVT
jgi:hypothetical protein